MISFIRLCGVMVCVTFGSTNATLADCSPCAHNCHDKTVPVESVPEVSDVRTELQELVNLYGFHSMNRFYVILYAKTQDTDFPYPYVYWPTENKVIEWGKGGWGPRLIESEVIDLKKDIEPDNSGMSGYYWSVTQTKQQICDCIYRGELFIIKKTIGGWTPISQHPQFSSVKAELQFLVDHKPDEVSGFTSISETEKKQRQASQFCVIGQQDGSYLAAYVWWKAKHRLYTWLPDATDADGSADIMDSFFQIDLRRELRDSDQEYGSTDYQMQRSYAEGILKACHKLGEYFTISPNN